MARQTIEHSDSRVVLGLGATGLSCARYLYAKGVPFAVIDSRAQPPGLAVLQSEMPGIDVFCGHYPQHLIELAAEVVVSPGIAMDEPIVQTAQAAGVSVVGDVDLFMREAKAPVVGITGSNAKSTVTELVAAMARAAGRTVGVGGNLGQPALDLLSTAIDLYVLELSSFQLERAGRLNLAVATVLNVSPDHLDRHNSMAAYQRAKHRIFSGCKNVVCHADDARTIPLLDPGVAVSSWCMGVPPDGGFGLRRQGTAEYLCLGEDALLPVTDVALCGRHNIANALAALALGHSVGLPLAAMLTALEGFSGLPHRCEYIGDIDAVRYINDSKGTNVGATEAALRGLGGRNDVVLIAGGQGKGADFSQLQAAVSQHCKLLILLGEAAPALQQALSASAPVMRVATLQEAMAAAVAHAEPGDTVLLSPACASFDMFSNFVARGEAFRALVTELMETRR